MSKISKANPAILNVVPHKKSHKTKTGHGPIMNPAPQGKTHKTHHGPILNPAPVKPTTGGSSHRPVMNPAPTKPSTKAPHVAVTNVFVPSKKTDK